MTRGGKDEERRKELQTVKNDIGQEKILNVVDTSAFITYPSLISHIEGQVFVPLSVIKQLDGLKNNSDTNVSKQARSASFFIEKAIKENKVALLTQFDRIDALDSESDNRIVGAAVRLKNSHPDSRVVLIATDRNMRIAAEGYGIAGINVVVKATKTRSMFQMPQLHPLLLMGLIVFVGLLSFVFFGLAALFVFIALGVIASNHYSDREEYGFEWDNDAGLHEESFFARNIGTGLNKNIYGIDI